MPSGRSLVVVALLASLTLAACADHDDPTAGPTAGPVASASGPTGSAPAPTPATPEARPTFQHGGPFSVTIAAAGDVLTHVAVRDDAQRNAGGNGYDFRPMFAQVAPLISAADLSLCHMETPISQTDTHLTAPGTLVFNSPHEVLDGVKSAGYDGCDFASNHDWDAGLDGLRSTTAAFAQAGLGYAGPGTDANQPTLVARYQVRGITVAHLAYTYTVLNAGGPNTKTPAGAPWIAAAMWPVQKAQGILAAAHRARAEGADLVVVSLHWGAEYDATPTKDQTALAEQLLASPDVDLILGTHVHVVQPCQSLHGKLVFYGLGNSLSNQAPAADKNLKPETQDGMVATVTVTRDAAGTVTDTATYQPTWVDLDGHVIRPATRSGDPTSWNRTVTAVSAMGGCAATPTG